MTTNARELAELATAYAGGNGLSFRNRIINGDCRIDQRNNGASVTAGFPVDRFEMSNSTSGTFSAQRVTDAPDGFTNSVRVTITSADTTLSSGALQIRQNIEGFNTADFGFGTSAAKPITLSFWVRSSLTGSFGGSLRNSAVNRSYPFAYNISSANTWEYKTITIGGDTSGTWLTDNGIGIRLAFSLGVAASFNGAAGSWASASLLSPTGATNLVATNGATWQVTGVQLEAGSVATPFERRPYGTELQLCQRYGRYMAFGTQGRVTASDRICYFATHEPMRSAPTASIIGGSVTGDNGSAAVTASSPSVLSVAASPNGGRFFIGGFGGLTVGDFWPLANGDRIFLVSEL